jgi:hypothetical protein
MVAKRRRGTCALCGSQKNAEFRALPSPCLLDPVNDSQDVCDACHKQNARAVRALQQDDSREAAVKRRRLHVAPAHSSAQPEARQPVGRMEVDADASMLQQQGGRTRAEAAAAAGPATSGGGPAESGGDGVAAPSSSATAQSPSIDAHEDPMDVDDSGELN